MVRRTHVLWTHAGTAGAESGEMLLLSGSVGRQNPDTSKPTAYIRKKIELIAVSRGKWLSPTGVRQLSECIGDWGGGRGM